MNLQKPVNQFFTTHILNFTSCYKKTTHVYDIGCNSKILSKAGKCLDKL